MQRRPVSTNYVPVSDLALPPLGPAKARSIQRSLDFRHCCVILDAHCIIFCIRELAPFNCHASWSEQRHPRALLAPDEIARRSDPARWRLSASTEGRLTSFARG